MKIKGPDRSRPSTSEKESQGSPSLRAIRKKNITPQHRLNPAQDKSLPTASTLLSIPIGTTTCCKQEIDEAQKRTAKMGAAEASAKARAALMSAPTRRVRKGRVRSEAVVSGGIVYISEQTAISQSAAGSGIKNESGDGEASAESMDAEQQAKKALENVQSLLQDVGSSPSKVVSAMLCVRDLGQDLEGVDRAWGRWIDGDNPPARTVVQSGGFAAGGSGSGVCISVSVTAHL